MTRLQRICLIIVLALLFTLPLLPAQTVEISRVYTRIEHLHPSWYQHRIVPLLRFNVWVRLAFYPGHGIHEIAGAEIMDPQGVRFPLDPVKSWDIDNREFGGWLRMKRRHYAHGGSLLALGLYRVTVTTTDGDSISRDFPVLPQPDREVRSLMRWEEPNGRQAGYIAGKYVSRDMADEAMKAYDFAEIILARRRGGEVEVRFSTTEERLDNLELVFLDDSYSLVADTDALTTWFSRTRMGREPLNNGEPLNLDGTPNRVLLTEEDLDIKDGRSLEEATHLYVELWSPRLALSGSDDRVVYHSRSRIVPITLESVDED